MPMSGAAEMVTNSFNGKPKATAYARRSNSRSRRTNGPADAFGSPLNESTQRRQTDFGNAAINNCNGRGGNWW
jgi:hypothetical protein